MVNVSEPATGVSVAPSIISESAGPGPQATSVLRVEPGLRVDGIDLETVLARLGNRVIPALQVGPQTAAELTAWPGLQQLDDAFVMSDQPELVHQVRRAHPLIRGIVDFRQSDTTDLPEIRRVTNAALARVALLPRHLATRDAISHLQRRLITVWIADEGSDLPTRVNHFNLLTSGANGIVSADPAGLRDVLETVFPRDRVTLLRQPHVIAHRGTPSKAPENTLEGALLAWEHGAGMIENDIHLSCDGHVIVHHDDTLERTTYGSGRVNAHTLAQLKEIRANRQFPEEFPDARVPALREYLQAFRDRDVVHVTEIKTADPAVIPPLAQLIRDTGSEDQLVVISFHAAQIQALRELLPGVSAGFLTFGQVDESDPLTSVRNVLEAVQPLSTTYNPFSGGVGVRFLEAARHRGITTWPWTYADRDSFVQAFTAGMNGLTTDFTHWASGWMVRLDATEDGRATAHLQDRSSVTVDAETVRLQDGWTAFRYWQDLGQGQGYFMYSQATEK